MATDFSYAPQPFLKMPAGTKKLAVESAIYLSSTDKNNKHISEKEFNKRIKETEDKFLELFGGYTSSNIGRGAYLSKTKEKFHEKIARILVFTDTETFHEKRQELEDWLVKKKNDWNQESISYEFEGDMYFI